MDTPLETTFERERVYTRRDACRKACGHASWIGLFAPAKTPRAVIARLHADAITAARSPEMKDCPDRRRARGDRHHARRVRSHGQDRDRKMDEGDERGQHHRAAAREPS
jgi:hypothetical protein